MSCKLSDKCDNVFACNVLRPEVELLGCSFYKPKKPMTNEEYLKSCDTEQLAKEIYGFVWCCNELWQQLCCNGDGTDEESDLRIVRKWLKQPHSKGVANEND